MPHRTPQSSPKGQKLLHGNNTVKLSPPPPPKTQISTIAEETSTATTSTTAVAATAEIKSLCHQYVTNSIWPGLGLFGESYLLFSIGTLKPLWEHLYPDCFSGNDVCSPALLGSLTYSVVLGVMTGMIALGYAANFVGRRNGSIITASIMTTGAWGLTLVSVFLTDNDNHVVWLYRSLSVLFFIFGIGVGGEYPLSASSASERAMGELQRKSAMEKLLQEQQRQHDEYSNYYNELYDTSMPTSPNSNSNNNAQTPQPTSPFNNIQSSKKATETDDNNDFTTNHHDQRYRGRQIQLVFSMQGLGILCNSVTMTALLLITGQGKFVYDDQGPEYSNVSLLLIWRITYALGAIMLTYVLVSRYRYLKESQVWEDDRKIRQQVQRSSLLEAVVTSKEEEERQLQMGQPDLIHNVSSVSSLSAPSVTVDYHTQAVVTTGLTLGDSPNLSPLSHHQHQRDAEGDSVQALHHAPSTDPEDDLKASPTQLFLRNYGLRLLGASTSWLLWDIAFYGNKLFQSTFLLTLTGESTTLVKFSMAASLNAAVALLGYFGAALIIDFVGRRNLQLYGFLITGSLFVCCGFLYFELSSAALVALYLGSSFFGQLGPNATTFLIPAEIFPTEMRTMAHGICAACGKVGALIAAIVFNYMDNDLDLFLLSGYASFAACLVTFCTIPETLGLDLYEVDKKWRMILEGRKGDYKGDANHPKFLSYYERSKLYGHKMAHIEVE